VKDLRPTTNAYFLLRQWRTRLHREAFGRKMNLFWEEKLTTKIHAIGKAIMHARAIETKEQAA
jgi:hypothetical protein